VACNGSCTVLVPWLGSVTLAGSAAAGSIFAGWGGACFGAGPCTVVLDGPKRLTARFEALRRVTVEKRGTGTGSVTSSPAGISCGSTCSLRVVNGAAVSLRAAADRGSRFAGWEGGCTGTAACTLTVVGAVHVVAAFDDTEPPSATALPRTVRRGKRATLRYSVADNSGSAAVVLRVLARTRVLALVRRRAEAATGQPTAAAWRVPRRLRRRTVRFCVQAADAAGNRSRQSCARLRVRG
jgi:hypothetical protein